MSSDLLFIHLSGILLFSEVGNSLDLDYNISSYMDTFIKLLFEQSKGFDTDNVMQTNQLRSPNG